MVETWEPAMISLAISLMGAILLYLLYRDKWVDQVRDELFEVRDELFLYAIDNNLEDSAAHRELRDHINRLIRYSHEISLFRYLTLLVARMIFGKMEPSKNFQVWKEAVDSLPAEHNKKLSEINMHVNAILAVHFVRSSLLLRSIAYVVDVCARVAHIKNAFVRCITPKIRVDVIDEEAMLLYGRH